MEQLSKTVFGIVILLCCLQASARPFPIRIINLLRTSVNCTLNSTSSASNPTFYAPWPVEPHCIASALDCIKRELDVTARNECEDMVNTKGPKDKHIDRAHDFFNHVIEDLEEGKENTRSNSSECACERSTPVPFSKFLDNMEKLLQTINSNQ